MLRLARDLELPDDAVTQTFAILARRSAGKTYLAKVLAEEMIDAGFPVVILDPVGVWHGLRSNSAGTGPGLPVTILGGEHGDLPLDAHAGVLVANLVASDPVAVVLDLSGFDSKAQQRQFVTDFAERLYRAKAQQSTRTPLHLIIDEADEFAPQKSFGTGDARMLGAFETLVRRGRARGIGVTMITQRPAVLNKNVLTQTECLIVMQITSPQDRKAIGEWVQGNASTDEQKIVDGSLASMVQGEAWFWSPAWLQMLKRVKIRKARTFDSSATPKAGEARVEPKVLAAVDLDRLKEGMERVVKDAERNDPRKLHAEIAQLKRELAKRPEGVKVEEVRVEVPVEVIPDWIEELFGDIVKTMGGVSGGAQRVQGTVAEGWKRLTDEKRVAARTRGRGSEPASARGITIPKPVVAPPAPRQQLKRSTGICPIPSDVGDLGKRERAILSVLAQYGTRTHRQLAMLTGYSAAASTIGAGLSDLRKRGLVTPSGIEITDRGREVAATFVEPLPVGQALLDYWMRHLGKRERAFLQILLDAYPDAVTHDEMAERAGYSPDASTVGAGMSKLRTLELADGWRASRDFVDAIG